MIVVKNPDIIKRSVYVDAKGLHRRKLFRAKYLTNAPPFLIGTERELVGWYTDVNNGGFIHDISPFARGCEVYQDSEWNDVNKLVIYQRTGFQNLIRTDIEARVNQLSYARFDCCQTYGLDIYQDWSKGYPPGLLPSMGEGAFSHCERFVDGVFFDWSYPMYVLNPSNFKVHCPGSIFCWPVTGGVGQRSDILITKDEFDLLMGVDVEAKKDWMVEHGFKAFQYKRIKPAQRGKC